eukprot:803435-Rhodomonas_salina.1
MHHIRPGRRLAIANADRGDATSVRERRVSCGHFTADLEQKRGVCNLSGRGDFDLAEVGHRLHVLARERDEEGRGLLVVRGVGRVRGRRLARRAVDDTLHLEPHLLRSPTQHRTAQTGCLARAFPK